MKNALKIFGFTILVTAFYAYVGQMVPQKETYPPEETAFSASLTTEELVGIGEEIVRGKGTCLTCHTIGETGGGLRFPDLAGVGAVAGTRKEGMGDVEYLGESLYEPNEYIVEGFVAGMPAVARPPINLNDQEILAVIAFLQSLGGTPSVTMDTKLQWQGQAPAAAPAAPVAGSAPRDGEALFAAYVCNTCHSLDNPTPLVGPSLYDLGTRMTKAQITESIMEPDATVAEGFPPGVMPATLKAGGFYEQVTAQELKNLVDFLASKQGN